MRKQRVIETIRVHTHTHVYTYICIYIHTYTRAQQRLLFSRVIYSRLYLFNIHNPRYKDMIQVSRAPLPRRTTTGSQITWTTCWKQKKGTRSMNTRNRPTGPRPKSHPTKSPMSQTPTCDRVRPDSPRSISISPNPFVSFLSMRQRVR